MLTKEFISLIGQETGMSKKETEQILSATTAVLRESLMAGKAIQLQGMGTLEVKERKARTIVHPRTGERSISPSRKQIAFKPVNNLKDTLKNI